MATQTARVWSATANGQEATVDVSFDDVTREISLFTLVNPTGLPFSFTITDKQTGRTFTRGNLVGNQTIPGPTGNNAVVYDEGRVVSRRFTFQTNLG